MRPKLMSIASGDLFSDPILFVERTLLSHVGENDLEQPVGESFQSCFFFGAGGYKEVWKCVFHGLLQCLICALFIFAACF